MKICQFCGAPIVKRPDQSSWNYNRRKYCDRTCSMAVTRQNGNGSVYNSATTLPDDEREYLQQLRRRLLA